MSQTDEFKLTITALKPAGESFPVLNFVTHVRRQDLPSEESVITTALRLIESTSSWKQGKTYYQNVKTYHRAKLPEDGAPWHCRVSEHTAAEASFDQFWDKLGKDKAVNEKEFVLGMTSNSL